ncbi:MAG: hypothetical protein BRC29_02850 [Nanohaloarchaea archaeon SW_7_43_1]|nr:MAG: hypothetical protein BRC29_02850 [Nanohaloarchaea archaeon SW_7_43_1]
MSAKNSIFSSLMLTALIASLIGTASAYTITPLDEPYSTEYVGDLTDSSRMINLTDSGEPANPDDISGFNFTHKYDASGGNKVSMQHLSEGYWYADITPDSLKGNTINYTLQETSGTGDEFYNTETLKFGNYSVELLSNTGTNLPPGGTVNVRVDVTDEWNNEPEKGATVNAYFTNGTKIHEIQELGNQDGSEYYNSKVNVPDVYDTSYLLHVNVTNKDDSIKNSDASFTHPVETSPVMSGEIEELESSGTCNNSSFFTECEREAEISTAYNVTGDTPKSVNLSLNVWNRSNSSWQNFTVKEMGQNNNLYRSDLTLPDLNTTAFSEEVQLVYNATGPEKNAVTERNITVRTYDISFGASSTAQQGGEYNLEIAFGKYFSSKPLDPSRIDANITVKNSTENLSEFNLEDMDYRDGVFQRDVDIGSDWEEGTYILEVEAEDIYESMKTDSDNFFVEDVNRTFNISGEIDDTVITGKNYSYNFTVENLQNSELELDAEYSDELEGFTWVNGSDNLSVPADSEINVTALFNMTEVVERSGEITLTDNSYNDSVGVDLNIPECDYRNGSICVETLGDLNASTNETGEIEKDYKVHYLAPKNDSTQLNQTSSGNISSMISFNPTTVEMNSSNNQQFVDLNYTVSGSGYFVGTVQVEDAGIPVELDSDAESQEVQFSVTSTLDLGTITSDESVTEQIEIENTGSALINSTSFESDQMTVNADSVQIDPGESRDVELSISEVSSTGSVRVTAESSDDQAVEVVEITGDAVTDYSEQASTLRNRINRLQSQVSDGENQNILNTASVNVSEIETLYQEGSYEEAGRVYEATEAEVNQVESRVNSGNQGPALGESSRPSSDESSMLPIIAVVIFVLLIIGFIAYTSIVPEEGDPLYKVLGR